MATDPVQQMREKLVAILDTAAAVVAITSRASGNIVEAQTLAAATLPSVAYAVVVVPRVGGDGDRRRFTVQFDAFAAKESVANELLYAVETTVTASAFAAGPQSMDAHPTRVTRRGVPTSEGPARATLDMTIDAQF